MKYFERLALALFLALPWCGCAGPRHGKGPRGYPPPKIILPGRPMPCLPYCVPM